MKYVIFGNAALCWIIAYYLKSISPNILTFVICDDTQKYFTINKSLIDKLRFFGLDQQDFFLGCLWSEENYIEESNIITMKNLLETTEVTYTLDTQKTKKYFEDKCEKVFKHWNYGEDPNSTVDRVHRVNKDLLEVVYEKSSINHLKLSENTVIKADIFIDMRI